MRTQHSWWYVSLSVSSIARTVKKLLGVLAVFVYEEVDGVWEHHQTLTPFPGFGTRSQFGSAVAIRDEWLLVGAWTNVTKHV